MTDFEQQIKAEDWVRKRKESLAKELKELREENGVRRGTFAEKGMHKAQAKNIEENRTNYTIDLLLTYLYHSGLDIEVKRRENTP